MIHRPGRALREARLAGCARTCVSNRSIWLAEVAWRQQPVQREPRRLVISGSSPVSAGRSITGGAMHLVQFGGVVA